MADDTGILVRECQTLAAAGFDVHLVAPDAPEGVRLGVRTWPSGRGRTEPRMRRMTAGAYHVYRRARALRPDLYHFPTWRGFRFIAAPPFRPGSRC